MLKHRGHEENAYEYRWWVNNANVFEITMQSSERNGESYRKNFRIAFFLSSKDIIHLLGADLHSRWKDTRAAISIKRIPRMVAERMPRY